MPKSKKEFLIEFLDYVDGIDADKKAKLVDRLFKYDGDIVVEEICNIVNPLLQSHMKFVEYLSSKKTDKYITTEFPLIVFSPTSPTELRVYKNIILSAHTNIVEISSSSFGAIKSVIAKYEEEHAGIISGLKWKNPKAYIEEFIDVSTARALTRFVFTDGALKDNEIRDIADAIDNERKPAKLEYAITPQDFTTMYKTGPHSCMAFSAGDREAWKFFDDFDMCPASWYSYYPFTKGAYITKNKKVVARAILFRNPKGPEDIWQYGRVYGDTPEIQQTFIKALESNNIFALDRHEPPAGFIFTMPGTVLNKTKTVAPWPYFDNLSRDASAWGISFNKDTNEFTVQYRPHKLAPINNRSGHIIGKDYIVLNCDCCEKRITGVVAAVENGEHTFCSNTCAFDFGYSLIVDGTGVKTYRKMQSEYIPVFEDSNVAFSTLKAAIDNGYYPLMRDVGVYPEDNAITVSGMQKQRISSSAGEVYNVLYQFVCEPFTISKIPLKLLPTKSLIEFHVEDGLVVEV